MNARRLSGWLNRVAGWIAVAVSLSLALLIWFGYRAVSEWQRSQDLLADRRAAETVGLFVSTLGRDMRGVQDSFLPAWWEELMLDPADDARSLVAVGFANYPYPESFFASRTGAANESMPFYSRSGRPPSWLATRPPEDPFPVFLHTSPPVARHLLERIRSDAAQGRTFAVFETRLGDVPYQVVCRLFYQDPFHERLVGLVGFTVNLAWARERYFPDFARQMSWLGNGLPVVIVDAAGRPVAGAPAAAGRGPIVRRWFPLTFFDPVRAGVDASAEPWHASWAVQAGIQDDPAQAAAVAGANRTLVIAAVATITLFLGLMLTARAARASARVAGMRSEFVSTVTHELKTPIATIRAIGDTLVRRRISDPEAMHEYAQLVVQESKRLARLIDNLLAYARITDVTEVYAFEAIDLASAVDEALDTCHAQLAEAGFEVHVEVPGDLPAVRADRTALGLVLDNLLDNAVRYSGTARWLEIRAMPAVGAPGLAARRPLPGGYVRFDVTDRGVGIPPEELGHVTRRFFRGRRATSGGSGLGLAIVSRIVTDHGGRLAIESGAGGGTTVRIELPAAE